MESQWNEKILSLLNTHDRNLLISYIEIDEIKNPEEKASKLKNIELRIKEIQDVIKILELKWGNSDKITQLEKELKIFYIFIKENKS